MEQIDVQRTVNLIEKNIDTIKTLDTFNTLLAHFVTTPKSKKEIQIFSNTYIVNRLSDVNTLNSLYARLTPELSNGNNTLFLNAICVDLSHLAMTVLEKIKTNLRDTVKEVFKLIILVYDKIREGGLINTHDRLEGIIYNANKIEYIFETIHPEPLDKNSLSQIIPSYTIDHIENHEEAVKAVGRITEYVIGNFNRLNHWSLLDVREGSLIKTSPLLAINNWVSLRNLVVCLNCYTE